MRLSFLVLMSLITLNAWSQYDVDGRLIQSYSGEGIEDAYVTLFSGDNFVGSVSSDKRGYFQLQSPSNTNLVLTISHIAYENQTLKLHPDSLRGRVYVLESIVNVSDEAMVKATRMGKDLPGTHSNISKKEIEQSNLGQDLPFLLNQIPGAVLNSDAGAGIGYTGIRIRGVDTISN